MANAVVVQSLSMLLVSANLELSDTKALEFGTESCLQIHTRRKVAHTLRTPKLKAFSKPF